LYREFGLVEAMLVRIHHAIENGDAELKREYPRKPHERRLELVDLYKQLEDLEARKAELTYEMKFMEMRLKMFQALSYKKG
jgi:hypothetical protein